MSEDRAAQIEAHLAGEVDFATLAEGLSPEETDQLRLAIAQMREAQTAVIVAGIREDLKTMHSAEQRRPGAAPVAKQRALWPRWLAAAAAVLLTIGGGYWIAGEQGRDAYAEYEYRDPGLPVVMGVIDDLTFAEGMTRFKRRDYAAARDSFVQLAGRNPANDTLTYYLGAAHYYGGDYAAAAGPLGRVSEDGSSLFQQRAAYLLGLNYVRGGEWGSARSVLQRIADDPDHRFRKQASAILPSLTE